VQRLKRIVISLAEELDNVEETDVEETVKNKMPRPCKKRRIRGNPNCNFFKPSGKRMIELEESKIDLSEFEAIRLKDFLGLSQEECADKMNISQSTFHRIILSARKKIADAIINGKAIKIEKD